MKISQVIEKTDEKIISAAKDNLIKVFHKTGECLSTLVEHNSAAISILELEDNILVSGSWDNTQRFWNLKELKGINDFKINDVYCNLRNSMIYNNGFLFVGGIKEIKIINVKHHQVIIDKITRHGKFNNYASKY